MAGDAVAHGATRGQLSSRRVPWPSVSGAQAGTLGATSLPHTHPPLLVRSAPPLPSQASGPCPLLFTLFCFQWKSHFTPKLRQNTDGLFQHLLAQSYRNIGTALRGPSIPCFNLAFSCHIRPIVPAPSKGKANCKHLHPEMHSQSLIFSPS